MTRLFHSSIIFDSNAGAYLSGATYGISTPGDTHKYYTSLKKNFLGKNALAYFLLPRLTKKKTL
jgi:hypothetical protein